MTVPGLAMARGPEAASGAGAAQRRFLEFFPDGFADENYEAWEREYKWALRAW